MPKNPEGEPTTNNEEVSERREKAREYINNWDELTREMAEDRNFMGYLLGRNLYIECIDELRDRYTGAETKEEKSKTLDWGKPAVKLFLRLARGDDLVDTFSDPEASGWAHNVYNISHYYYGFDRANKETTEKDLVIQGPQKGYLKKAIKEGEIVTAAVNDEADNAIERVEARQVDPNETFLLGGDFDKNGDVVGGKEISNHDYIEMHKKARKIALERARKLEEELGLGES